MPAAPPHQRYRRASSRTSRAFQPGRFVWAPSRRYIYFEGRAGDTQNIWRVTVDPLTEKWVDGPERLTTGAGEETNVAISPDGTRLRLHDDVEQNEAVGVSIRLSAAAASPASRIRLRTAAREKWISTRAPTARRSPIAPSGLAATSCGNDRLPKDGSGCCSRARTGEW